MHFGKHTSSLLESRIHFFISAECLGLGVCFKEREYTSDLETCFCHIGLHRIQAYVIKTSCSFN